MEEETKLLELEVDDAKLSNPESYDKFPTLKVVRGNVDKMNAAALQLNKFESNAKLIHQKLTKCFDSRGRKLLKNELQEAQQKTAKSFETLRKKQDALKKSLSAARKTFHELMEKLSSQKSDEVININLTEEDERNVADEIKT